MEAEALGRQVLTDDGHLQVGGGLAAVLLGQRQSEPAGGIGPPAHLSQQLLPVLAGDAAVFPVRAGPLPAMVEESAVVVLLLERFDLALDELVQSVQGDLDLGWDGEVHEPFSLYASGCTSGQGTFRPEDPCLD